jgi:hypothetical protein
LLSPPCTGVTFCRQAQAHHLDDVGLGHPELGRLGLIDAQHQLGVLVHGVVHADDVRRRLEGRAHLPATATWPA